MLSAAEVAERSDRILTEVERAIVGKRGALELILIGFLADGHVLLEDFPGLAKTLMARSFAQVCDMEFARIQFTPDLMPSDVTGSAIYSPRTSESSSSPAPSSPTCCWRTRSTARPPRRRRRSWRRCRSTR